MLSQPLLRIQERTTQETLYAVTRGVELIVLQILATSMVLVSDLSLLLIMSIGLFLVDPTTAIGTLIIFAIIGYFLYKYMHVKAGTLGVNSSKLNIASNSKIVEVFSSYRESVVRNRRDFYAREIGKLRFDLADTSADINFMPYVSKYVIETSVILGALLIGAFQFILQDATHAIGTLTIFLAAGTRIAPAVLRVQQGMIAVRGSIGQAKPTLDLLEELGDSPLIENTNDAPETIHEGFTPIISMKDLIFKYPGSQKIAIDVTSLEIPAGSSVAIVGSSGAGKTTLIDILLGVIKPDAGQISISGLPPLEAITRWPGAISYVPQDVVIAEGSIRENVGLGFPPESATNELVMHAIEIANLKSFVDSLPNKLESQVGERGANISGGQRQRLGIARALFTHPLLLVLDEATSSLDGQTESSISKAIQSLKGHTTVVMIAHRLSTVKNADLVVYLSDGKIIDVGSFEEIRNRVPDFDLQAKLVGL
jgi:ABC-type multidrug transport system fused ATPase/permease subunit